MAAPPPSSRRRYREYLEARRRSLKAGKDQTDLALAADAAKAEKDKAARNKRHRSFLTLFRAFWGQLRGHFPQVFAALATLSVASLLVLVMPACTKAAIDYIMTDHPGPAGIPRWVPIPEALRDPAIDNRVRLLFVLGGVMLSVTFVRVVVGIAGRWQMTRLTKRTQVLMRRRVFEHAVNLPLQRIYQIKSGGVPTLLQDDAGGAAELLFSLLYNPLNAIIQLIGALAILAAVDWRMLAGALLLIPIVWVTHATWVSRIRPLYKDIRAARVSIDSHSTETFGGMRVVRGFSRQRGEAARFQTGNHLMTRQEILTWWWSRGVDVAWQIMIPIASTCVLVYGGLGVIQHRLTIGDVTMFTAYLLMLLGPLEVLATSAAAMQSQLAGLDRILDILDEPLEFQGARSGLVVTRETARARITLDNVTFSYPPAKDADPSKPREPTIKSVSLDIRPGETIALVGPSGSGKTTLCNLIARFYDPQEGSVSLDGVDLRKIDVGSYRRLLGIVEQDVFLFDGSVADNIAYARRDATDDEIREAARAANAAEFIDKLEKGYDTLIGERGVRLSGGQKQRLAIARALLADPRILILDEATSNLDTESERLIQRSLTRLMRGRTGVVIAHRLSTIRHADRIVVIENGRITEVGTHDELLARSGRYADFLRLQLEGQPLPVEAHDGAENAA